MHFKQRSTTLSLGIIVMFFCVSLVGCEGKKKAADSELPNRDYEWMLGRWERDNDEILAEIEQGLKGMEFDGEEDKARSVERAKELGKVSFDFTLTRDVVMQRNTRGATGKWDLLEGDKNLVKIELIFGEARTPVKLERVNQARMKMTTSDGFEEETITLNRTR